MSRDNAQYVRVSFSPEVPAPHRTLVLEAVPDARESSDADVRIVQDLDAHLPGPSTVVLAAVEPETLAPHWRAHRLFHLLSPDAPTLEVAATIRRAAGQMVDGCADLLGPVELRHGWSIGDSAARPKLLSELSHWAQLAKVSRRGTDRLLSIAEELISNALYNAPIDDRGTRLHAHKSRTERVVLEGASVRVKFLSDDARVALVVRDPFGSLVPEVVFDNIARCLGAGLDQVATKQGGAGLGLYTVLLASNHLAITVVPGRTEFVAIVDKRASRPTGRCFNWFGRLPAGR